MNPNTTPSPYFSPLRDQLVQLGQVTPVLSLSMPNNISPLQYQLSDFTATRPCNFMLQQVPELSTAPEAPNVRGEISCENSAVSNTHSQPLEEHTSVIGPAFSLTDDSKAGHDLQARDESKTGPSDGSGVSFTDNTCTVGLDKCETQKFSASVPTIQSSKILEPSIDPEVCIGSVLSRTNEHTEDQHATYVNVSLLTAGSSVSQKATEQECQVQPSSADQGNQKNIASQDEQNLPLICSQPSEEPTSVIGPAFSLADDSKAGYDLQARDESKTGPSDGSGVSFTDNTCTVGLDKCETQKFSDSVTTIQSSKILEPSIDPQVCIGSVLSLTSEHTEDQHATDVNINLLTAGSSVSQKATEQRCQVQPSSADQRNLENIASQDVQNVPQNPISDSSILSKSNNPAMISNESGIYKICIASQSSLNNISTYRENICSTVANTQIENSITPKEYSGSDAVDTSNFCAVGTISVGPPQIVSSTVEAATSTLLGSSPEQQDANKIGFKPGQGCSETLEMESACDTSVAYQESQILPPAKAKDPEVVDLDTEDIEDCLLVNIDLSKHFVPFGLQIHNTKVVIDDSDTDDENRAGSEPEAEDQSLPAESVSCSDSSSLSSGVVGDQHKSPQSTVCSTVVVSENNNCNLIGSLNMEVEEIETETDILIRSIKSILKEPVIPSILNTQENITTPLDVQQSDTLSSRCSDLSNTKDNNVVPDIANSATTSFTDHLITDHQKSFFDTVHSDFESMELSVDDETPLSIENEYTNLKVITPSKFSLPDNLPNHMPESTKCASTTSVSSILSKTVSPSPVIQAYDHNAFPDQATESFHQHESTTHISFSDKENITYVTTAEPQKQNLEVVNNSKRATRSKTQNKCHQREKRMKSITNSTKQVSFAESPKNPDHSEISLSDGDSAVLFETEPKSSSIFCKLCYLDFPSRMDLVTHTWNFHRNPMNESYKCELCDKYFVSSSLLKLHHKTCVTSDKQLVKTEIVAEDDIVETVKTNTGLSTASLCDDPISIPREDCMGQKEIYHNRLKRNKDSCKEVRFVRSETNVLGINESPNSETQIRDNHKERSIRFVQLDKPAVYSSVTCIDDDETEQEDVEPDISCSAAVELHFPKSLESNNGRLNKEAMHKCSNCPAMFSNLPQLKEHQSVSECCKTSKNNYFKCFVCESAFPESNLRYHHMSCSRKCRKGIRMYCSMCSESFKSPGDKEAHLNLSKSCWLNEVQLILDQDMIKARNANQGRKKVAAQKSQSPLTNEGKSKILFYACQDRSEKEADALLHLRDSSDRRNKNVHPELLAKQTPLNEVNRKQNPMKDKKEIVEGEKEIVEGEKEIVEGEKEIVQCMICTAEFSSHGELINHYNKKKCTAVNHNKKKCTSSIRASPRINKDLPKSNKLEIIHNPVSVTCEVCHLEFADDFKLAEHLQLSHACFHSENTNKEVFSVNETIKKVGKKTLSCEIVTGISSSTRNITLFSPNKGCRPVLEQQIDKDSCIIIDLNDNTDAATSHNSDVQVLNYVKEDQLSLSKQQSELEVNIEKRLNDVNKVAPVLLNSAMTVLDNSKTIQVCAIDKKCRDRNEKFSDSSSSDFASEIEAESSSSEESGVEYKCRLCSKTFIRQSLLIRHTKSHHSSHGRNIHCKVCTRKFHDLTGLQAHLLQFKYCFIPLTRKLWETKEDPQFCNICRKSVRSPKDLRKHCFKSMACRLRYIKVLLRSIKGKDSNQNSNSTKVLSSSKSSEIDFPPSEIPEFSKSKQSNSGVSSSVPDFGEKHHISDNQNALQPNVGHNSTIIAACNTTPAPLKECLNCGNTFSDFIGHLFKQQACLDFYGIYSSKCPVLLPFCFQCKQRFDNTLMLTKHTCKGFVAYSHTCTACGLKFTSDTNFNSHTELCDKAVSLRTLSRNHRDENSTVVKNPHKKGEHFPAPIVKLVTSTSDSVCSAEQSFPCLICDAKFPLLRLLMQHSYQHVEETPLKCDRCDTMFIHYNQFVSHQTFHIRMDKENGILPEPVQSKDLPPVLEKFGSSDVSNAYSVKDPQSHKVSHNLSVCLFCHQEFPNRTAKFNHISNTPACLGIMKYIIANKFFSKDPRDNQLYEIKTTGSNHCEFCQRNFSDKISHYLQSACIDRLEEAILRFRAFPCPSEPIVSKSVSKETTSTSSPFITTYNFHCPICKQRFENENLLSSHQIQEHGQSSVRKSPTEGSVMDKVNEQDSLYCLTCTKCLRTITEVENHNSLCKKPDMVLPLSTVAGADWEQRNLMCKICNIKYTLKRFLFKHMISRHCDGTNVLMVAAGQKTSLCAICSKSILRLSVHSHFQQHKKTYLEIIREIPLRDNVICLFCKQLFSKRNIHEHLKKHSVSSLFDSHNNDGTKVVLNKGSSEESQTKVSLLKRPSEDSQTKVSLLKRPSEDSQTKVKQKKQKLVTALHTTDDTYSEVRCNMCHKVFPSQGKFRLHFRDSHKQHDHKTWKQRFKVVEPLKSKHDFVEASGDLTFNNIRKSLSNGNKNGKNYAHGEFGIDGNDNKSTPFTHKIAKFHQIGKCKICHKQFKNFSMFRFHLKNFHNRHAPEDEKKFFQSVAPLGKKKSFDGISGSPHAVSTIPERQFTSFYRMLDTDVNSSNQNHNALARSGSSTSHSSASTTGSRESLFRVCLVCQTSFSNASLYQTHLKTHIIPCNVVLRDHFDQQSVNGESEHEEDVEIIENFLYVDVKVENDVLDVENDVLDVET